MVRSLFFRPRWRQSLYLLSILYHFTDDVYSDILVPKFCCMWRANVFSYIPVSRYTRVTQRWYVDVNVTVIVKFPLLSANIHRSCVYMLQVKVHVKLRLKLIVMISLNIHMMTSQDHICVQCVTNGLQQKRAWIITKHNTLNTACIHVLTVRNVFQISIIWGYTWFYIATSTGALIVERVVVTAKS